MYICICICIHAHHPPDDFRQAALLVSFDQLLQGFQGGGVHEGHGSRLESLL